VSLQLFGHPFSSYTWKVLIALWADDTPFDFRMLGPDHPENGDELRRHWPFGMSNRRAIRCANATPVCIRNISESSGLKRMACSNRLMASSGSPLKSLK
jgi:hypothetical protein